ncbi:lipid droplet-associated hydrolase [Nilaparvata lugens]|uniref:lipid droplet-associated hydrolase n=1 Tax=Nilaparvata lugens TaxID=108931 RepID=UPI00193E41E6|nr:lipid droplet-associated hydrolase [Nilaparvata lugens]XP_039290800.1 lipid droplet-associated hydrolase [Nilaparvata lugens]
MTREDNWLMVDDIPTRLLSWGERPGVKSQNSGSKSVILLLTGNPGMIGFYETFLAEIHNQLAIPVWAICHAGHEIPSKEEQSRFGVATVNAIDKVYDVAEQVSHKVVFIEKFIPEDKNIYIIAHSFGAKVTVELLKIPELRKRISKCFLVFPTLQHMKETPSGKFLHPMFTVYLCSTIVFLSWIFTLFPVSIRIWLLKMVFIMKGHSSVEKTFIDATLRLIQPLCLRNVFALAYDEMLKIVDLDKEVIAECKDKLKVYFGAEDGWAPLTYQERLKEAVPGIDSSTLDRRFRHDFVLDTSEGVAQIIVDQLKKIVT